MKMHQLLKTIEQLECSLAELYAWFSHRFQEDTKTTTFFISMSRDEKSHAQIVKFQRSLVSRNQDQFKDVDIDLSAIEDLTNKIKKLAKDKSDITLEDALGLCLVFEQNAAEQHYRSVAMLSNPEVGKLVENLARSDEKHLQRLESFLVDMGV